MKTKDALLAALLICGFLLLTKILQLSLTPGFFQGLRTDVYGLASNLAVQLVLAGAVTVFVLSLCAASWHRSEQRHERWMAEQAAAQAERQKRLEESSRPYLTHRNDRGSTAA